MSCAGCRLRVCSMTAVVIIDVYVSEMYVHRVSNALE